MTKTCRTQDWIQALLVTASIERTSTLVVVRETTQEIKAIAEWLKQTPVERRELEYVHTTSQTAGYMEQELEFF